MAVVMLAMPEEVQGVAMVAKMVAQKAATASAEDVEASAVVRAEAVDWGAEIACAHHSRSNQCLVHRHSIGCPCHRRRRRRFGRRRGMSRHTSRLAARPVDWAGGCRAVRAAAARSVAIWVAPSWAVIAGGWVTVAVVERAQLC